VNKEVRPNGSVFKLLLVEGLPLCGRYAGKRLLSPPEGRWAPLLEETSEASRMVLTGSALYSPPDGIPAGPLAVKLAGSGDRLTSKGSRTAVLMTDGAIRRNSSACANNLLRCVQKVKYWAGAR
jgi:hypothetical protein